MNTKSNFPHDEMLRIFNSMQDGQTLNGLNYVQYIHEGKYALEINVAGVSKDEIEVESVGDTILNIRFKCRSKTKGIQLPRKDISLTLQKQYSTKNLDVSLKDGILRIVADKGKRKKVEIRVD